MQKIRSIGIIIRQYLDVQAAKKLVNATATPKLDYCNALLVGLPARSTISLEQASKCSEHCCKTNNVWKETRPYNPL